jgi:hypothetical protein
MAFRSFGLSCGLFGWGLVVPIGLLIPGLSATAVPLSDPNAGQIQIPKVSLPDDVGAAVLRQVANRTGRALYNFRIADSQPKVWPDGCLGLGKPDMVCAQMLTHGWQVIATDGQQSWNYRTNITGSLLTLEPTPVKVAPRAGAVPLPPYALPPRRPIAVGASRPPLRPVVASPPGATGISTAPAPESRQQASAQVQSVNGRVTLVFVNKTNAAITYQAVDDTNMRSLPGKSTVSLQSLVLPATVTFRRQDGGLLNATPRPSEQPGQLIVTLDAALDLSLDRTTLSIESNGAVFLN